MSYNTEAERDAWVTFIWTIENYDSSWYMQSPVFRFGSINNGQWKGQWNGHLMVSSTKIKSSFFSYTLRRQSNFYWKTTEVEYDYAILAEDDSVVGVKEREKIMLSADGAQGSALLASLKDVTTTGREDFLSRGTMRIRYRLWRNDGKDVKPVKFFARTVLDVKKRSFPWDIERFSSLEPRHKATHKMCTHATKELSLSLNLKVNETDQITICFGSSEMNTELLKFHLFITDANGYQINCGKYESRIHGYKDSIIYTLPFTKKYLIEHKDEYLKNDVLSLYCICSWSDGYVLDEVLERIDFGFTSPSTTNQISAKSSTPNAKVSHLDEMLDLKEDFQCLYDEGILSDVKLRTTTQTFHAHKTILAARSPVFRAMFTTDMKEKIQDCVDVPDLEDDTLRRMLLYMYTNTLEVLQWESALNLYAAADKNGIICLKSKCSSFLKSKLCPNNVCDVLVLADMHGDDDLKEAVQNYILKHEEDVYSSDEWKVFAKNNTLAVEIMLLKWNKQ